MADEEEKLTIQIESIDGSEPAEAMDPELIRQTGIVDDLADADMAEDASDDGADIRLLAAEDSMVTTTSLRISKMRIRDFRLPVLLPLLSAVVL